MSAHSVSGRTIEHLCVLDLVGAALDALTKTVEQLDDQDQRGSAAVLASKIAQEMCRCRDLADSVPLEQWSTKSLRRYVRSVDALKAAIRREWPGSTVNAVVFLAAIIDMVASVEEQIPRSMRYLDHRLVWGRMHRLLFDLYCMFDPGVEANAEIDRGCIVGAMMRHEVRA